MSHKNIDKVWGYEEIISNSPLYCGKVLVVNPEGQMSYHYHKLKDETFYVIEGFPTLYYGTGDRFEDSMVIALSPGDSFHVPPGLRHRVYNGTDSIVRIFEVSTQDFEDDSYRLCPSS